MKGAVAAILGFILNLAYRLLGLGGRKQTFGFLSRQHNSMSEDFRRVHRLCEEVPGWDCRVQTRMIDGGPLAKISYLFHMFAEVNLIAKSRIVFVEGYNPTLSLLDLKSVDLRGDAINRCVPTEPLVIQLWHAGGMYKKFGFQTVGTPEGRSAEDARVFKMHRNYSWVICSGEAARPVYAEAFSLPIERTVALGRPSSDALYEGIDEARERVWEVYPELRDSEKPLVVFAPTLRRTTDHLPMDDLRTYLEAQSDELGVNMVWSYHPVLAPKNESRVATADLLHVADLVVTDYSSVVYDAALIGVPIAFYVPDIAGYRATPGLNTDPTEVAPHISFATPEDMRAFLEGFARDKGAYPQADEDAFAAGAVDASEPGSARRIVDFALEQVEK